MSNPEEPRTLLSGAFRQAVAAAQPARVLVGALPPEPAGRLIVIGAGKAAAAMARALEEHYGPERLEGLVVTRYAHALATRKIRVLEAGHPLPDEAGRRATAAILGLLHDLDDDDLVLCLLSGGGSALLTAPRGVTLEEKIDLTRQLLRSGASIQEMNVVRKHLSEVKGGWLAATAAPARLLTLIISDVVGDDQSSIASGPTVPDPSTFAEALAVLERYRITSPAARHYLMEGVKGRVPETPKPGQSLFRRAKTHLAASNQTSLEAAASYLREQGVTSHILSSFVTGEASLVAAVHAALIRQVLEYGQPFEPPCALLSGGETTVTVRGGGRGGRNSEFALALALELPSLERVHAVVADSDGVDGSEDNAGVFVSPRLFRQVSRREAERRLAGNDSYTLFQQADHLLVTGPTHTNVNDIRIFLITT